MIIVGYVATTTACADVHLCLTELLFLWFVIFCGLLFDFLLACDRISAWTLRFILFLAAMLTEVRGQSRQFDWHPCLRER